MQHSHRNPIWVHRQVDGVAMGSPLGPMLANIFLSQFEETLSSHSRFYFRYMDDIIRTMPKNGGSILLGLVNSLHERFTLELESERGLPFLDMCLFSSCDNLKTEWLSKKTDTGVVLNYHAIAPTIYKSGIISGFVHQKFNTTTSWPAFHVGIEKAEKILSDNQYPRAVCKKVINATLNSSLGQCSQIPSEKHIINNGSSARNIFLPLEYRGNISDNFKSKMKKIVPDFSPPRSSGHVYHH